MDWNKDYIEWCEIMMQEPNERDHIIFMAGYTFYSIGQNKSSNSEYVSQAKSCLNCKAKGRGECIPCHGCSDFSNWQPEHDFT